MNQELKAILLKIKRDQAQAAQLTALLYQLGTTGWPKLNESAGELIKLKGLSHVFYDMSGNVWEWCHDLWDSALYQSRLPHAELNRAPDEDASAPVLRVRRGGAWSYNANFCRIARRSWLGAHRFGSDVGGRLLRRSV